MAEKELSLYECGHCGSVCPEDDRELHARKAHDVEPSDIEFSLVETDDAEAWLSLLEDHDETIVYATTTVDRPPAEITPAWLADRFPSADYVEAVDRIEGRQVASVGEEPASLVCSACGEECHSGRTVDGTMHYYHGENEDCERDARGHLEAAATTDGRPPRAALVQIAAALGIVAAVTYGLFLTMPLLEIPTAGELTTIHLVGVLLLGVAVLVVLLVAAFGLAVLLTSYRPGGSQA